MKRIFAAVLVLGLLSVGTAIAVANSGSKAPATATSSASAPEPHPHIRAALRELREARHELETAARDFGGHRKEAIEAVDAAIKQLKEALEYDKK